MPLRLLIELLVAVAVVAAGWNTSFRDWAGEVVPTLRMESAMPNGKRTKSAADSQRNAQRDRPIYNQNRTFTGHVYYQDEAGKKYWIDGAGKRHYEK